MLSSFPEELILLPQTSPKEDIDFGEKNDHDISSPLPVVINCCTPSIADAATARRAYSGDPDRATARAACRAAAE
jgi:hypothetical protein